MRTVYRFCKMNSKNSLNRENTYEEKKNDQFGIMEFNMKTFSCYSAIPYFIRSGIVMANAEENISVSRTI